MLASTKFVDKKSFQMFLSFNTSKFGKAWYTILLVESKDNKGFNRVLH